MTEVASATAAPNCWTRSRSRSAAQRQQVSRARPQFDGLDGLGDEVGGAGLDGALAQGAVVLAGDHHHRRLARRAAAAQPADEFDAVEPGHEVIDDDEVAGLLDHIGQGGDRVFERQRDRVADLVGQPRQDHQVGLVVFDDGDAQHGGGRLRVC
jgi:hypothetical protein